MSTVRDKDAGIVVCLGGASLLINLAVVAWLGVIHGGDSFRYVNGAEDFLANRPFQVPSVSQYFGYVAVIAASSLVGAGLTGVVALQLGVAALAVIAVYDLGRQLSGRAAGVVAAALLVVDLDVAQWHAYVLTDSLYISLVVLTTWCVHRAASAGGAGAYAAAILVGLFTASIRPNGWVFGPLAAIYWIGRSTLSKRARIGIAFAMVAAMAAVISVALYQRYYAVVAHPPKGWDNTRAFADVWLGLFGSAPSRENRLALAATRVLSELGHVRAVFSARHNAAVIAMLAVIYPLATIGWLQRRREPLSALMLAVIAGHLLIVALTFADRDGRYLLYVFPLMIVFAACGAVSLAAALSSRRRSPSPPASSRR